MQKATSIGLSASVLVLFIVVANSPWLPRGARAEETPKCSSKFHEPGNTCGTLVTCTVGQCESWFQPAAGLNRFKAGLLTDNWIPGDLTPCGSAGECFLSPMGTVCTKGPGTTRYTPTLVDGESCYVD
jgi:hypothetical protein